MSRFNVYVSSVAWAALSVWPGASSAVTLGQRIRNQPPTVYAGLSLWNGNGTANASTANFGGSSFAGTPPSGFSAWGASDTWNPADKSAANVTLSGGNLVATSGTGSSTTSEVRSVGGHASGKWYYELSCGVSAGNAPGFATKAASLGTAGYFGNADTLGIAFEDSGARFFGSRVNGAWQGNASSTRVDFAIDLDAGLVWIRTSANTNWNNSGTANPATGVGGFDISAMTTLAQSNGRVFKCTTAGTTGASEPTWNLGDNATTADGTAVWTQVGGHEAEQSSGSWNAPLNSITTAEGLWNSGEVTIFVSDDHVETRASAFSIGSDLIKQYISVKRTGSIPPVEADYSPGATVKTTGTNILTIDSGALWGFTFINGQGSSSLMNFNLGSSRRLYLEDCVLNYATTNAGFGSILTIGSGNIELVNTRIKYGSSGPRMQGGFIKFVWRNTPNAIDSGGSAPGFLIDSMNGPFVFRGLDLSSLTGNLYNGFGNGPGNHRLDLIDCKLNSALTMAVQSVPTPPTDAEGTGVYSSNSSDSGNYHFLWITNSGTVEGVNTSCRVGGAALGGNPIAHLLVVHGAGVLKTPWIARYNAAVGASKTISMHAIAFDSHLTVIPDIVTCYMEVETLDDSGGSPLSTRHMTRPALAWGATLGSRTANTADTGEDWTASAPARANSHAYAAGAFIKVNGLLFRAEGAGTSAASLPGAYASATDGSRVTDGGVVFQAGWRMKFSLSVTPQVVGVVKARVFADCWKNDNPNAFVLVVDPKIDIT